MEGFIAKNKSRRSKIQWHSVRFSVL